MRNNWKGQTMDEGENLTDRLRILLMDDPNISEKKMFGGICFLLNGNMLCGITNKGDFMARVGKELESEARSRPHVRDMDFTGKPMKGFLFVAEEGLQTTEQLNDWIALCTRFVGTLPAK